jgi:hypothetical protein
VAGSVERRARIVGDATFPPTLTASKWSTAYEALRKRALKSNGVATATGGWRNPQTAPPGAVVVGMTAPGLTNAQAIQLIRAYHSAARAAFSLWAQYAALAYGWDPPDGDTLDATVRRGGLSYGADACVALWLELYRLTRELDAGESDVRLTLDDGFSDADFVADVRRELQQDGADAYFRIPIGTCTDKLTGRQRFPLPPCDARGEFRDPYTGVKVRCDKPGDCEPTLVDDPVTYIANKLVPIALVLGALWLITRPTRRQPRRSRRLRN